MKSLALAVVLALCAVSIGAQEEPPPTKLMYEYICSWVNYANYIHQVHETETDRCGNYTAGGLTSPGIVACGSGSSPSDTRTFWRASVNCSADNGCVVEGWISCGFLQTQRFYTLHCPGVGSDSSHPFGAAQGGETGASCQNADGTGQQSCACQGGDLVYTGKLGPESE